MSLAHSGNAQPSIDREEHWHLDGDENKPAARRTATFLYGEAVDGPLQGQYVMVKLGYNSSTGNYELLTAGSGGTTTPATYYLVDTASNTITDTASNTIIHNW